MGTLSQYADLFGKELADYFHKKSLEETREERAQTGATKIAKFDEAVVSRALAVHALREAFDTLQESAEEKEMMRATLKKYEEVCGEKNEDFLARHEMQVVIPSGQALAKKSLADHLRKKYSSVLQAAKQPRQ
jgi:hypothetical protein